MQVSTKILLSLLTLSTALLVAGISVNTNTSNSNVREAEAQLSLSLLTPGFVIAVSCIIYILRNYMTTPRNVDYGLPVGDARDRPIIGPDLPPLERTQAFDKFLDTDLFKTTFEKLQRRPESDAPDMSKLYNLDFA